MAGWILLGLIVLGGAAGAAYYLLRSGGMEEALQLDDRLAEAVARATGGRYRLDLDGMTIAPSRGVVIIHNPHLYPAPDLSTPDSAFRITFTAPEVRLEGIADWQALVRGEALTAGTVRMDRPELRIDRPADGRSYRLAVETLRVEIAEGNIRANGVRLADHPEASPTSGRLRFAAPEVRLDGVADWKRLTDDRALTADTLHLHRPELHLTASDSAAPADTTRSLHTRLARALRDVRLAHVRVDDGVVSYTRPAGQSADTLRGFQLRLRAFDVEAGAGRALFSESVEAELGRHERSLASGRYRLIVGPFRASTDTRRLKIDTLAVAPALGHVEMMRRLGHRKGQYDTAARGVALSGFDLYAWLETGALTAGAMDVDGLHFAYADDMRWPPGPRRSGPRLPHEWFRTMERAVRIDTLRVRGGQVRYRRFASDGERPGTLVFDGVYATCYNLTNDPGRMSASTPAVVHTTARLAGSGRLRMTMRYDLLANGPQFSYQGELLDMDAPALNAIFVPAQGVEVREGRIDSLRFSVRVRGNQARGTLESRYRDLHIRLVDKATGQQNLGRRLRSFVADRRIRTHNPTRPDRTPHVGTIARTYRPGDSFFQSIWLDLRSGIESITGIDRW